MAKTFKRDLTVNHCGPKSEFKGSKKATAKYKNQKFELIAKSRSKY